jgi:hypothetical protein
MTSALVNYRRWSTALKLRDSPSLRLGSFCQNCGTRPHLADRVRSDTRPRLADWVRSAKARPYLAEWVRFAKIPALTSHFLDGVRFAETYRKPKLTCWPQVRLGTINGRFGRYDFRPALHRVCVLQTCAATRRGVHSGL